ncbi:Retroelement [Phytophthora megakarya]|uniref:Retroelement n=1 Tax=Phytophthora megakarya TaxID=4795 RepID=A0A225UNY0_9STRA|nr:Retroelement [Phytophthora megakarya]
MLYHSLLVWVDDLLLFAKNAEEYLCKLRELFVVLRARRLKLNAKKCTLFSTSVVWCGKVIDGSGIQHSPDRLKALTDMQLPPTAAALQQFLCAANWLRDSMVDYARVVGPLQAKHAAWAEEVSSRGSRS